jgi:adenosylcobyric acid synthase
MKKFACWILILALLSTFLAACGATEAPAPEPTQPPAAEPTTAPAPQAEEKTLVRQTGLHVPSHLKVHGYEIHHGRTVSNLRSALRMEGGAEVGAVSPDGRIWGSYLHGIFDADLFRRWFINRLRQRRGLAPLPGVQAPYDLEPAFERLADAVRSHLDMKRIYRLLNL